jgi:hypothetical protein
MSARKTGNRSLLRILKFTQISGTPYFTCPVQRKSGRPTGIGARSAAAATHRILQYHQPEQVSGTEMGETKAGKTTGMAGHQRESPNQRYLPA